MSGISPASQIMAHLQVCQAKVMPVIYKAFSSVGTVSSNKGESEAGNISRRSYWRYAFKKIQTH
jgi:hypothetical protein